MKGIIKQYINQLKENRSMKRTTVTYIIIGCALLILFCMVAVNGIVSIADSRESNTNMRMLSRSCNTVDLIFRDVQSLITKDIESSSVIAEALYGQPPEDTSKINSEINQTVSSSNLIKSVYIVNLRYDIVYSSDMAACSVDDFFDQDIIRIMKNSKSGNTLYYPRIFNYPTIGDNTAPQNYISCIYNNSPSGAIIINLSQEHFQSIVNPESGNDSSKTIIVNSAGNVLSNSQPSNFASNISDEEFFSEILKQNSSSGSFQISGSLATYVRSSYLGFYYIEITDSTIYSGYSLWLILLIAGFAVLLIILYFGASIYITATSFRSSSKDTHKSYDDQLSEDHSHDNHSSDDPEMLSKIKYNFLPSKRSELIHKLLVGTFTYSQDELDEYNIVFDKKFFGVIMGRIDRLKEINPANVPMIKYGIMNIGDEVFSKVGRVYSIESNEFDIAWVLNYNDERPLIPAVEQVQKFVENIYKITVSFGCNFGADSMEDISDLYHNAQYSLSYRLSKGYNSIILYNSIKDKANDICEYPEDIEKDIIDDITSQNKELMRKNIHKFMQTISTAPYSTVITHTDRLLSAVDQIAAKITSSEDAVTVNNVETMTRMETIAEIENFVMARCESVSIKISETKTDSKKDMIANTIVDYIDEHFRDSNLSIDMIANEVNRSANYTRSIFKQSQGISISEYISNKRFNEVCRMLVETNIPAQEIGKQIGLNSGSYFYTAFKKHTGYTPDQYRKIHQSINNTEDIGINTEQSDTNDKDYN